MTAAKKEILLKSKLLLKQKETQWSAQDWENAYRCVCEEAISKVPKNQKVKSKRSICLVLDE